MLDSAVMAPYESNGFDRDLKGDDSFDCGVPGFVNTS
jgi:hypothetical protein